jgi:IS30 family transposase
MIKTYKHLSPSDRDHIALRLSQGATKTAIGLELGYSKATISREVSRNASARYGSYLGNQAQKRAEIKAEHAHNHPRLRNGDIRMYVTSHLELGWSPEQISGRMGIEHPGWSISHEAIYQYIYAPKNPDREYLIKRLRRAYRIRRHKNAGRVPHATRIPNRVSIDQRPASILTREQFGHWESDSLISRQSHASLNSLTERKTKLLFLTKMESNTASETSSAIIERLWALPMSAKRTITMDNGKENTQHEAVTKKLKTKCYFAHPYCSWERGTNENTNGLVRWYLPKGTDFSTVTKEQISVIETALNNRPRKCLKYKTPFEAASSFVALAH